MSFMARAKSTYQFMNNQVFTLNYGYDAASNRTSMTDPQSSTTNHVYDALNRLQTLQSPQGNFGFTYDALNRRTQMTRPNGVNTNYSYDSLSRLLSILHQVGASTIDGATYTYDNVGNRLTKLNQLNSQTETYGYDNIYQLLSVLQGANTTESYTYDKVGNRLSDVSGATYTVNGRNQLTIVSGSPNTTFTYDNNGNTATKVDGTGTTTYTWNSQNQLKQVSLPGGATVTFKYDPFGRRVQKVSASGTVNYVYSGANVIEEIDSTGVVLAKYVQLLGIDQTLAMLRGGATTYYQADGLGSITSLTDIAGGIANSYTYESFGSLKTSTGSIVNPFRYTSRDFDGENGLHYYRARYYDAKSGRFLSEDALRFLQGSNFYQYVWNNPLLLTDPFGLATVINNSGIPIVVTGNPGSGHGQGDQQYAVLPIDGNLHGGPNPITSYPTASDALAAAQMIQGPSQKPSGTISDIDFYFSPITGCKQKIFGDELGPIYTLSLRDGNVIAIPDPVGMVEALERYLAR